MNEGDNMNTQRTIVVLLSVIATLLTLNLLVTGSRRALAQYGASGPVEPTVVSGMVIQAGSGRHLWRFWSDGAVDKTFAVMQSACDIPINCGPTPVIPGSCPSDVTRNGEVEFDDMLSVLSDWGPCIK